MFIEHCSSLKFSKKIKQHLLLKLAATHLVTKLIYFFNFLHF